MVMFWVYCIISIVLWWTLPELLTRWRSRIPFLQKDQTGKHCPILHHAETFESIAGGFRWHGSHRGSAFNGPENTIQGFKKVLESTINTDLIEFDVRLSKDRKLILLHDATLNRTTNGKGNVSEFTLHQLQQLDAAYFYSTDGKSFPLRGTGLRIPELIELLELVKDSPVRILFDVKDIEAIQSVYEIIEAFHLENRTILGAVDEKINEEIRKTKDKSIPLCSGFRLFFILPIFHFFGLSWMIPIQQEIYLGIGSFTSTSLIRSLHKRGIRVALFQPFLSWDTQSWHKRCKAAGVDFIISDKPEILRQVLRNE